MIFFSDYLIAFIALITISCYYYFRFSKQRKFFEKFPIPPTKPLVGNALDFKTPSDVLKTFHKYAKEQGTMVHIKMGLMGHVLLCSDYKFLEFLLSSNKVLHKSLNMKYLVPWIGTGLVTANGDQKWKNHRKIITPTFHFKILEQFVDIFDSCGDTLVEKLSKMSGSTSLDIHPYLTLCTLEAIWASAMGIKLDIQNSNEHSSFYNSGKEMCRIFITRTMSLVKRYDFLFSFTEDYKLQKKAITILHDYTNQAIDRKYNELKNRQTNESNTDDFGIKKRKVFLDMLLEASADGQPLSQEEIREEVDTFMFGGHDTTAAAAGFILFCLSKNKDIQERILEEQEQIFGDEKNPKITYATLQSMKYLETVIKEGLRMYSPIPVYGRFTDHELKYDGMTIPKGVNIIIFAHGIHMNPEYYPEPEKFNPSRWENVEGKLPFAFIPFSAGPRNCIGQKFAMLELKSLISKIIRNFELFPAKPEHILQLSAETVLKSLNGINQ